MMRVHNHGGKCCGIKHIHEFPYAPTALCASLPSRVVYQGAGGEMNHPGKSFHPGGLPMQTGRERLTELLKYIDKEKKSHLVEVVMYSNQATAWKEELELHGFKMVTEFTNSNTSSKLFVYHRVTHKGEVVKQGEE